MVRLKCFLGVFFVFLLSSTSVYALTSAQETIVNEEYEKLTPETYDTIMNAKSDSEEYDILVEFTDTTSMGAYASTLKSYMSYSNQLKNDKTVYAGRATVDDIITLTDQDYIKYVELQQPISGFYADSIPYNVNKTEAPVIWENTTGSGVKVAVLDTGISSHPDLNIAGGTSIISSDYTDNDGHGTEVAGVLAAVLNDKGLTGVAPNASLYAVKVMETTTGNLSDAIDGMQWVIDNNMSIVVMSFGFDGFSNIFRDKVNTFYQNGGLSVAAAGNDGSSVVKYPAKYSKVIAVGATNETDGKASFSPSSVDIELVAPGANINTTNNNNGYSVVSGTSFATPHVAGVAALVWAYNQSISNSQLRTKLHVDALDLGVFRKDDDYGFGLVRVNTSFIDYANYEDFYYYEVNEWFENNTQQEYATGYGYFDDVTYDDGRYLLIRTYPLDDNRRIYEELRVVGEYQQISALATFNTTITATDDSYVNSSSANTNYGSNQELINLETATIYVQPFIQYKLSSLPSTADIIDADIILYVTQTPTNDQFDVNNVDASWSESSITWNNKPSIAGNLMRPTITSSDDETNFIMGNGDITTAVKNDYTNNRNASFHLESGISTAAIFKSSESGLSSKRPRLTVVYTDSSVDCNGTIQAVTENSDLQPLSGLNVRLNGAHNGTTDTSGVLNIPFRPAFCNTNQIVTVYCSDNTTLCGNQSTAINYNWDNDTVHFSCNICQAKKNLYIDLKDISVTYKSPNLYNITALVHVDNVNTNNINISFFGQGSSGLFTQSENKSINAAAYTDYNVSVAWDLRDIKYIHVYVDSNNGIKESSESDNYVLRPYIEQQILANVQINTGLPLIDDIIWAYLDIFIDNTTQENAKYQIAIGQPNKNSIVNSSNKYTIDNYGWGFDRIVVFNGVPNGVEKYVGLAGAFTNSSGKRVVLAYGNDIAGTVAAVKRLIDARNTLFFDDNSQTASLIDKYDLKGISVYDVMTNSENKNTYNKNNESFRRVVEKILNDNQYDLDIRTVKTYNDNTTLRLKHVNADYTQNYKDAITGTAMPVVLSRGLWSDLFSWQTFGQELTTDPNSPRDVWLIEITGGPGQDSNTSPNYNFTNMTEFYVPALLSGVENYTAQDTLQYVGFSNGCRATLSSLDRYDASGKTNAGYIFDQNDGQYKAASMSANLVQDFIGVGCPGNFTGFSPVKSILTDVGDKVVQSLEKEGNLHPSMGDVASKTCAFTSFFSPISKAFSCGVAKYLGDGPDAISIGLFNDYYQFMSLTSDKQPGENVTVNKLTIVYGVGVGTSDGVVTNTDAQAIYNTVTATNNKQLCDQFATHNGLPDNGYVEEVIKIRLRGETLPWYYFCSTS